MYPGKQVLLCSQIQEEIEPEQEEILVSNFDCILYVLFDIILCANNAHQKEHK